MYVEYSSNNSGGRWWLKDEDWKALEAAGWEVAWVKDEPAGTFRRAGEDRWLGALATRAVRRGLSLREAATEWEKVTGASATDAGCACCGVPHSFTEYDDDGKYLRSGPEGVHEARWGEE